MGILDELLAGGQRQEEYSNFVDRYEEGHPSQGYSDQEVLKRYVKCPTPYRLTSTLRRHKRH